VNTKTKATKYQDKEDPECFAVNKNDYIKDIQIYNGDKLGFKGKKFEATIYYQGTKKEEIAKIAAYDEDTQRLTVTFDTPVCISTLKYMEIDME